MQIKMKTLRIFRKNKKGMVLVIMLAILTVFVILPSLYIALINLEEQFPDKLGENQIKMLKSYQQGERALFFIDQAAKYTSQQSVQELARDGGLDISRCGQYLGYNLWTSEVGDCYPKLSEIKNDLGKTINDNLEIYLLSYSIPIPLDNYEVSLLRTDEGRVDIIGSAKKNLDVDIVSVQEEGVIAAVIEKIKTFLGSGKCDDLGAFASQYVGTPYSVSSSGGLVTPQRARSVGTTCSTFVQSIYYYGLGAGENPRGNGNAICNHPKMEKIGRGAESLEVGDLFSATSKCTKLGKIYGHTGMYVGKGTVSTAMVGKLKHKTFTPNPDGEHVFIHSGTVGYTTFDELFGSSGCYYNYVFCRHKKCI